MNTGMTYIYYVQSAQAQDENPLETECSEDDNCCINDLCCFDDGALSISALIVIPILLFCIKIPVQKNWLVDAGKKGLDFGLFIMRGWALGLFLAVCGFIGMLYTPVTKQGLNDGGGCGVPEGWLPLVITLGLISIIFLIVSFAKKPQSVTA